MIITILLGVLALLAGVLAQEDCGACNDIYIVCMDACVKAHPLLPGVHSQCNSACFCETAKIRHCGDECGYDEEPCNRNAEMPEEVRRVVVKAAIPSAGSDDTAPTGPVSIASPSEGHITVEIVPPSTTLVAIARRTHVKKQTDGSPSVGDECSGCPTLIGSCIGQTCPANDKEGAVKCVCDHLTPECPANCFLGICPEKIALDFDFYCPLITPPNPPAGKVVAAEPLKVLARQVANDKINSLPECGQC